MTRKFLTLAAGALMLGMSSMSALAAGKTIAVSWKTFQEERWKTDEAAIKAVVEAAGNTYVSTDAQGSAQKQAADIEGLISQKVDVIMVVAFDSDAILPSFKAASDAGVKMLSYDVLVEDPNALYVTFDNVGVGRLIAKEILAVKPEGNFAFIKGDKGDPNATFLFQGMMEVLKESLDSGKVKNVCETFTDGWKPDNAQKNMEQCLTSTGNKVDAVLAQNDGMASASSPLSKRRAWSAFRSVARMATWLPSTASLSAPRPSRSGRMPASLAGLRLKLQTPLPRARTRHRFPASASSPAVRRALK
jgi:D-xylose transport system substrate-binding protein